MLISKPQKEPGMLYTMGCKDESWISIAKYLKEDVPRIVSSQDVDTVERILSVVFKSLPSNFNQFIRWVAEIRRTQDVNFNLSSEEKSRLILKKEVLKQVYETELFKHVNKFLSSVGYEDHPPYVASKVCSQGTEILSGNASNAVCCRETCAKGPVEENVTVVGRDGNIRDVDLLVPLTQADPTRCNCDQELAHPAGNDVITALLLALSPQTWTGIKDQTLLQEIKQLTSMVTFPTLLQEEVLLLRRHLQLLKQCQENKEDEELSVPAY